MRQIIKRLNQVMAPGAKNMSENTFPALSEHTVCWGRWKMNKEPQINI